MTTNDTYYKNATGEWNKCKSNQNTNNYSE